MIINRCKYYYQFEKGTLNLETPVHNPVNIFKNYNLQGKKAENLLGSPILIAQVVYMADT